MTLDAFAKQNYLAIESFRRNGAAVRTPVWFVQEGETLYVWTLADSGKAKRIRRDGRIRIAPCTASGAPLGECQFTPECLPPVFGQSLPVVFTQSLPP